jgi:fatty acid synthase subunit beta
VQITHAMASLFSSTPTRPLVLHSTAVRVSLLVPASPLSAWVASEVLAQDFHDSRAGLDEDIVPVVDDEDEVSAGPTNEPQVKLLARFLAFAADKTSSAELTQVLLAAIERFNELFLGSISIQTLVEGYEAEDRAEVLKAYYKAFAAAREALGESKVKVGSTSALLDASREGKAELYALFGGQGVNDVCPLVLP